MNRAVKAQKMARGWKFWIKKVEELYYLCRENKGPDQLRALFSHTQNVVFPMTLLNCSLVCVYIGCKFFGQSAISRGMTKAILTLEQFLVPYPKGTQVCE